MALNVNEKETPQSHQTGANNAAVNSAPENGQTGRPGMDIFGGTFYGSLIAPNAGSEIVKKAHDAFVKALEKHKADVELGIIDIDRENHGSLKFSSIVLAVRNKLTVRTASYITLILEATGEELKPYYQNYNGVNVEVKRVTSDAYDAELIRIVTQEVAKKFPADTYLPVEAVVVPRDFNFEDPSAVTSLAFYATTAIANELARQDKNFVELNLQEARGIRGSNFNITMTVSREPERDAVGQPVRADVKMLFQTISPNKGGQNLVNNGDQDKTFGKLSGFVDLVWAPVIPQSGFGGYPGATPQLKPGQLPTQIYAARMVVTDIKSTFALTPASILMNLLPVFGLSQNNNWFQAFKPLPCNDAIDIRDPGALNLEANLGGDGKSPFGAKIDTKSNDFSLSDLGSLLAQTIAPGLIVSLDVPEAGPMTPFLSFFAAASLGNPIARQTLVQAAATLTNGVVPNTYGGPIFEDMDNRIHLGYWIDSNGVKHDIREIDYLAVANLSERDPALIRKWSDTFDVSSGEPLNKRLATRWSMISSFTSEKAVCTGFARRVTLAPDFLMKLFEGAVASGINPSIQTPLTNSDLNNRRVVPDFATNAVLAPSVAFQPRTPNQVNGVAGQFGRYGV